MSKSKVVGFNAKKIASEMLANIVTEQTRRLIEYAQEEVAKIGDTIKTYHSKNGMDRTGNLLDSLCWGVSYNGRLVGGGFYRDKRATEDSYLHERWGDQDLNTLYPVNGRMFAEDYLKRYGNSGKGDGWRVFFAVLAPYWGYWEHGFVYKIKGKSAGFLKFAVMTQAFDEVKRDLRPARVRFRSIVPKYTQKGIQKRRKRDFEGKIKDYYRYGNANIK